MLGLHQPTTGTVGFDGVPLDALDRGALRRHFGVVTQEPHLFTGTIRDNIALARPDASLAEVVEAARLACLHEEIEAMPLGYDTRLSEGMGLSGGQRQRLALARALLGRPTVLLLDEATSHLDTVTEARIEWNLAMLPQTRIVIAHRLSTVRDAGQIVVIDGGRIVEHGRHRDLLARGGHYAALVANQDGPVIGQVIARLFAVRRAAPEPPAEVVHTPRAEGPRSRSAAAGVKFTEQRTGDRSVWPHPPLAGLNSFTATPTIRADDTGWLTRSEEDAEDDENG
nr:ATP-binding cassette domain-containing protein [Microbispora cellulosiformans]